MAAHDAWALACRLFAGGTPVLCTMLSPRDSAALSALGRAVKATAVDQRFVLCPYCNQHRAQVWGGGPGGRSCHCPECGPVAVASDVAAALLLDEDWLRQKLRLALEIESRDGIDDLGGDVWRLGEARRAPVLLTRDLTRIWREPELLDRVRVPGANVRVVAPRPRHAYVVMSGHGFEWLPLEERFTFYGGGIAYIPSPPVVREPAPMIDPSAPVHGPFSADFRWVTVSEWPHGPIRCTDGQVAVFKSLWSFKGEPMTAERIMQRAGLDSDKLIDLFKIKPRDKGKPEAEGPLAAYRALVVTQKRQGLYSMPCAANRSTALA